MATQAVFATKRPTSGKPEDDTVATRIRSDRERLQEDDDEAREEYDCPAGDACMEQRTSGW